MFALTACDSSKTIVQSELPLADPVSPVADLSDDTLIAPLAPPLDIIYSNQSLTFSWQIPAWKTHAEISKVSLFAFNTITAAEELISDQISVTENNFILNVDPKQTDPKNWLYRIELCTSTNCVSSYRTAANTPPTATQLTLAEGGSDVLWQPTLNRRGNVLVAVSKNTQSAEVHFKLRSSWVYASSISPAGLGDKAGTSVDVAMSDTGDTIAIAVYHPQDSEINISVFDRLGEAWFETSQWDTSYVADELPAPGNLIAMAGDASALLVIKQNGVSRYSRADLDYSETSTVSKETPILTWDASPDLTQLAWLSQKNGGGIELNRSTLIEQSYEQSLISSGMPLISTAGATIQINTRGDEILLAAWQSEENSQASPSVWHAAITDDRVTVLSVQSEAFAGGPPDQLVFASNDDLQTSYLSWSDTAQQQIQIYQMNKKSLLQSFDLLGALSLAQQPYRLAVSGDGTSLSWANDMVYILEQRRDTNRQKVAMVD